MRLRTSAPDSVSEPVPAQAPAPEAPAPEAETAPAAAEPAKPAAAAKAPQKPDIETALGTRWAVWVGGIALAAPGAQG
jgi:uncharacterized membrane protein